MAPSVAILGHRGWLGQRVSPALVQAGIPTKLITRKGSPAGQVSDGAELVEVDWADAEAFTQALQGVNLVISLVGQPGLAAQMTLPPILAKAGIKLFIPSDFAFTHTSAEDQLVPVMKNKEVLEHELRKYGVPYLNILSGNFAEFALNTPRIGVDVPNNRILHTGNTEIQPINLCTREYVAAAITSLLLTQPLSSLAGRSIGLTELTPTGADIEKALALKHGTSPKVARSTDQVSITKIQDKDPLALMDLVKLKWSRGEHSVGNDVYEVEGYRKLCVDDLIVGDKLGEYREVAVPYTLDAFFP